MKRSAEISVEILIGLAVVFAAYLWATLAPNKEVPVKWMGLALSTAILFGYPIYWARKQHKNDRFWLYWFAFLLLHLIIAIAILRPLAQVPLILFVPTTMAELAIINPILTRQ